MPETTEPGVSQKETRIPTWAWVHALSLEAPLVAVLWQLVLAEAHRIRLLPGVIVGLGLVVWLVYVVDRLLDGMGTNPDSLDARHAFYARNRRLISWVALPLMAGLLAWVGLCSIPEGMLWQSVALALLVVIYLGSYAARQHRRWLGLVGAFAGLGSVLVVLELPISNGVKLQLAGVGMLMMILGFFQRIEKGRKRGFPKEFLGGLLFALGTSMGIQFFAFGDGAVMLSLDALLLWGLFTLNLIGISCVESAAGAGDAESVPAQWPGLSRRYAWLLALFTVVTAVTCVQPNQVWAGNRVLPWTVLVSLLLHGFLWIQRSRQTPLSYRVLTDLALVLPTLWVFLS